MDIEIKLGVPLFAATQKLKDRKEAESKLPASAGDNDTGQRVLSMAFCVNRLKETRHVAGNARLRGFTDSAAPDDQSREVTQLFRRFLRENSADNPPYFCVSAAILGRLIHAFKEEYITKDKQRRMTGV